MASPRAGNRFVNGGMGGIMAGMGLLAKGRRVEQAHGGSFEVKILYRAYLWQ